jgi:transmembrane sensor
MERDRLLYLLEQEKTGRSSEEEVTELQGWYDAEKRRPDVSNTMSEPALQALESKIFAKIQDKLDGEPLVLTHPPVKSIVPEFYRIAVSVVVLLMVGIGIYYFYNKTNTRHETTAYGETRVVILPDGSEVTLNGNSEITYASNWEVGNVREVSLSGEAYFKVTHTIDHQKFRVRTNDNFSLDVLGTQFTVANRKSGTRVVLNEGRVRCNLGEKASDTLILRPGEMVQFAQKPTEYIRKHVEADNYSAWKDHKLVFENTTLVEVSKILEETYGLKTETENPQLLTRQISGSVPTDNVKILLEGIASASEVEIQQEGDRLIISDTKRP